MPVTSAKHAHAPALVALGAAIRRARLDRGTSQEHLAHLSQVDRSYMSSIERGGQNPSVMTLLRVAQAMEMTMAELMAAAEL